MKGFLKKGAISVLIIVAVLATVGFYSERQVSAVDRTTYRNLKLFTEVLDIIEKNYVDEVKSRSLIEGAINGMLKSLDPHSVYLTPEMYKELEVDTRGKFGGVGIEITILKDVLTVVSPIEDTPAFLAGIKAGDQIVRIDGQSTKDITIMEAVKKLRGPRGTKVTVSIMRENLTVPLEITLARAEIRVKSIRTRIYDQNYGYIRIVSFQERTASDLRKAIQDLETRAKPLKGLIVDLRNNPGGLLPQAIEVSDIFLKSGIIVSIKGRAKGMDSRALAKDQGDEPVCPVVVLVNEGSASASEIVAGALQSHKKAVLIGSPTFGKGSVQTIIPLDEGNALKLTTAKYYTPDGRSIQSEGIKPDVAVKLVKPADEKETDELLRDNQLKVALDHLRTK